MRNLPFYNSLTDPKGTGYGVVRTPRISFYLKKNEEKKSNEASKMFNHHPPLKHTHTHFEKEKISGSAHVLKKYFHSFCFFKI